MNILFTGVGRRIELLQAFREAALVLDKPLKIFGADMAGTAPALSYCDRVRRVVSMRDPGYIQNLLDICREDHIDLLIPTIDTDLLELSENRDRFTETGTRVLISAPEMIRICRDKNRTSQFFIDCGLRAPMPVDDLRLSDVWYDTTSSSNGCHLLSCIGTPVTVRLNSGAFTELHPGETALVPYICGAYRIEPAVSDGTAAVIRTSV